VPDRNIEMSDALATSGRRPDVTLLFDLPASDARRRGRSPTRQAERSIDRLDEEELEFYRRVREGFLARAAQEPYRFRILDSSGSREATAAQLDGFMADILAEAKR
jgi:dTMP kinase